MTEAARPDGGAITRGFLFADLRGYTAYVEGHGDAAASALLDVYRRLVRDVVARHDGAEIKTEGDSFYIVFPSASGAVLCGLDITAAAAVQCLADPEHPIRVGIGVHAGESVAAAEDYVGSAVNIAARVCAQAKPGEVLVTDTVRGLTRTSGRLTFTPIGRRTLKGITEPIALYHAELAGSSAVVASGHGPIWRRPWVLAGMGGLLVLAVVAVVVAKGGFGPGGSSPSASVAASLPVAEPVDRLVYAAAFPFRPSEPACDEFGEQRLMLGGLSGGDAVRIMPPGDLWENLPAWSPDGKFIAFVGQDQLSATSVYVVSPDGSGLRNLIPAVPAGADPNATFIQSRPAWSSDGRQILFTYGANGVWVVGADGSNLRRLIAPPAGPQPTPDSDGVTPEMTPLSLGSASWMRDGRISVDVTDLNKDVVSRPILYSAAPDGTGLSPLPGVPADFGVASVAWGPDGQAAFVNYTLLADPDQPPTSDLFILDRGSSVPRKVPGTTGITAAAAWSPDGTRLAFTTGQLYTIKSDGTDRQQVAVAAGTTACAVDWARVPVASLPVPTASPAPGETPGPLPFHRGILALGTYVTDLFVPRMQFRVDAGWVAISNFLDGLALARPDAVGIQEIDVGRVQVVFDTPCLTGATRTIGPTAREFFDHLRQNPYLDAGNPRPVVIGSKTGLAMDVTVARTPTAEDCPGQPERWLDRVWLFQIGETSFWFRAQHQIRIVSIDVGDGPAVTFLYGGAPEGANAFINAAQPIIDSLTFP